MPRSRRHLNPKALAREAGRRGSRMRSWSGGRPDQATVLVEERLADGRYKVRRDSWPCSIYVPVTPAGSEIPTPRRMPLLFEQGNAQRPFLLWRARPFTLGPGEPEGAVLVPGPWLRRAARNVGRYLPDVPEETTLLLGTVTPSESRDPGRILRAFPSSEGVDRVWSQAWSVVINGAAQEEGEPGSDVVALWQSGGVRLVMIEGAVEAEETYGDGFTEGYEAGYSDPGEFISPYDSGGSACYEGTGYDPTFNYSYPAPPTGHGDDYNSGWVDGHLAGWTARYDEGYTAGGCTI